ncbi:Transcriptional regulator, GntR family [Pseudonocardia sp. Ae717_Ps2]|nr:Transcriptional regulator, GntR family [Pseudonocardia sp. Ae717_Ps2]
MSESIRRSGRDKVYDSLRQQIISLKLKPGEAISEKEIAASLGVSRTPVREGLILLVDEGLASIYPKIGSFVSRIDPRKVGDAQFVREAVELASLQEIPDTLDVELVQLLQWNLEQQHGTDSPDESFRLDEDFHQGLLALAGRGAVWPTVAAAKGHLDRARRLGLPEAKPIASIAREHQEIFDAVVAHDLGEARDRLRAHLRGIYDQIDRLRETFPDFFTNGVNATPTRRVVAVWD